MRPPGSSFGGAHRAGYADCLRRFRCFPFQSVQHVLSGLLAQVGFTRMLYYEVAVLVVAVGLTGKVFRFLPEERHGADRIARIFFPVLAGTAVAVFLSGYSGAV